jgi:branched-subunit amino acid transport protein AzlD
MESTRLITAILLMGFIIFLTRLFPFVFFRHRESPGLLNYLERNIPPLIMLLLVVYCLKDVRWIEAPYGSREILAIGVVATIHLWKRNALLSIMSGTVLYMLLLRI